MVGLALSDSGSGISREDLDRILQPFFSTRPRARGVGWRGTSGLWVLEHGGRVDVGLSGSAAARFTIHLPAVKSAATPGGPGA